MTEFIETLRHYCRNPRCRSKLPAPVANSSDAFCTKGCHSSFYRHRCLVCEAPMQRKTERQLICGKRRCRNALQARKSPGRYTPTSSRVSPLKNPMKMGIKTGVETDRPLRVVAAGAPITANTYHCAGIGAGKALAEADRVNEAHWRAAQAGKKGYRRLPNPSPSPVTSVVMEAATVLIGDSLNIPAFLRRTSSPPAALPLAA